MYSNENFNVDRITMEHIRQFDWCTSDYEYETHFVTEHDLDNSVTEKLLRNAYYDPLVKLTSENDNQGDRIDWDEVLNRKQIQNRVFRMYVAGMRAPPPYPRLSALTRKQHLQCLKVLSASHPEVLPDENIYRPTKFDLKVFQEVKDIYEAEQKEFIEWAKTLWTNSHCVRALRPKPIIEKIYEGETKMRKHAMQSYPKNYTMVAQIPLDGDDAGYKLVHEKDLIQVEMCDVPAVSCPRVLDRKWRVLQPCLVPPPCHKHPCQIVLPNERGACVLGAEEALRALAGAAAAHAAALAASEGALRTLLDTHRDWQLPLVVEPNLTAEGESGTVAALGSEWWDAPEEPDQRTHRAYTHLLHNALVTDSERLRLSEKMNTEEERQSSESVGVRGDTPPPGEGGGTSTPDEDSSDDEDKLLIDIPGDDSDRATEVTAESEEVRESPPRDEGPPPPPAPTPSHAEPTDIGVYTCTCGEWTRPPRSLALWRLTAPAASTPSHTLLVHTPHKAREECGEVLLEPVVEYQAEVCASRAPAPHRAALALALALRRANALLNVHVVADTGEVVRVCREEPAALRSEGAEGARRLAALLHTVTRLRPGTYVLLHRRAHGDHALLYTTTDHPAPLPPPTPRTAPPPPLLAPTLLPIHKYRRMLPCAFPPHPEMVYRARPRQPPPAQQGSSGAQGAAGGPERGHQRPKKKRKKRRKQ